ncbi:MAG: ATP-dependent Clp protease ATP-binding subunit [Pontibacterium sp.]
MFQNYVERSTKKVLQTLDRAVSELVNRHLNVLTPDFLLLALLTDPDNEAHQIIARLTQEPKILVSNITQQIRLHYQHAMPVKSDQVVASQEVNALFITALEEMEKLGDQYISTGALFLAMFNGKTGHCATLLKEANLSLQPAQKALKSIRSGRAITDADAESKQEGLSRYTKDLTEMARQGELDPVIGREEEIALVIQTLSRRKKNNPVLIGEAGVGKTVIVEGLAQRMVNAEVPDTLMNKKLLSLDMSEIIAGAKMRGEFEERLKMVRDEVINARGQIILFIDELHSVVGAGAGGGGMDAPSMLKTSLAQGSLQVIGADTLDEYHRFVEADKALERRFHPVLVREPSIAQTVEILQGIAPRYEKHHQVSYAPEALEAAANLAERYINDRNLPDKAVDLVDEAGSRKHIRMVFIPQDVRKLELELQTLKQQKTDAFNAQGFEEAAKIQMALLKVEAELKAVRKGWEVQRKGVDGVVSIEDIAEVVSRWTGIPAARMVEAEAEKLARMEDKLHRRIVGQDDAVKAVADAIRRNRSGITSAKRPIGCFLFLGPTGVGKTELGKALAQFLLDDETRIVRLDMSEYMERHEVSKMIGAPPGYIGYGEGGQLTEKVRRNPYTVVLLDELEKAHPDVFNMLLQILEEGRLTDAQGRAVSFRNTILIGTSNLGTEALSPENRSIGFIRDETPDYKEAKTLVMHEVKKFFKPEFINRLDDIIVFHYLEKAHVQKIAKMFIAELTERMKHRNISLNVSDAVVLKLAQDGFEPVYGARPLRREVERQIENPLAMKIVMNECPNGSNVTLTLTEGEISFEICPPPDKN